MRMKNEIQKELIKKALSSSAIKYVLYSAGVVAIIYVGGIVMKVIGNTTQSFKFMQEAFKK